MKTRHCLTLTAVALLLAAGPARSGADVSVPGQKVDSGLGELPHYSTWVDRSGRNPLGKPVGNRVLGESLDDGLGELPHYSKWVDPTGRDPLGRAATRVAVAKR